MDNHLNFDREILKQLPEQPGIYQMLDKDGKIIYVGKSKCLKNRVPTYFTPNPKWEKAKKMVPFIHDVKWIVTDTHLEAMLLECELIKKIRPFFNTMMKNDSRYVYLKVSEKRAGKVLKIVWEREEDTFGPFRSRGRIEDLLLFFPNLYPVTKNADGSCDFEYHVFPKKMNEKEYEENRKQLLRMFAKSTEMESFMESLKKRMFQEAEKERFELAGKYRNFLEHISYVNHEIHLYENLSQQYILYAVPKENRYKLFLIHNGRVLHRIWAEKLNLRTRKKFVKEALTIYKQMPTPVYENEKAGRDFQDILYREISQKMEQEKEKVPEAEEMYGIQIRTVLE